YARPIVFFFSSRRRHTRFSRDWSSDVCSSDLSDRYQWINESPVAAASLGQVHRARLLNGDKVVVKVQRPGIDVICYTDLAALRKIGRASCREREEASGAGEPAQKGRDLTKQDI